MFNFFPNCQLQLRQQDREEFIFPL
jgi:ubiquitin-protein ligase